uniref:Uncharacterized protein n=1 Tax=Vitis vinifera TaxID=29760 RepID=A5ALX0_VITVI|nr:hypothetical protein VITISV_042490 [Vitis vinifera]
MEILELFTSSWGSNSGDAYFPNRNHLIGGLQGENWDLDNKYLKQNIKKRWSQISGSTQENFAGAQNGCEISQTNKMAAKSFRSRRLISQPKADYAALRNWPSAWSDLLPLALTSSFQL